MGSQVNFAIFVQKGSFAQNCYHFSLKSTRKLNQPARLSNNELHGIQISKSCSTVARRSNNIAMIKIFVHRSPAQDSGGFLAANLAGASPYHRHGDQCEGG